MSDSDARLKVTADTTGAVGPLDAVTAANERVGESGRKAGRDSDAAIQPLPASYLKASAAVSEFAAQAEKGGKGAAKAAAIADLALQELEAEILDLKAAGKPTADLEAAMEGLRAKTASATEQVGRFRAAAADAADKMKAATARAGETDGAITGLADAVKAANFALGEMVTKVGVSLVVFKQAYTETRNLIGKMKEFGIDVDAATREFLNITRAAEEFVNVETQAQTATRENSEAATELAQSQAILARRYNDTASSIEEAREKLQRHSRAAYESYAAIKQENDALFGKESALKSTTEALLGAIAAEEKEGTLTAAQVEIVKAALKSKAEEYQRAGQVIDAALQAEIEKRGVAVDAVVELSTTTVSSAESRAAAEEAAGAREVAAIQASADAREKAIDDAQAALDKARAATDAAEAGQFADGTAEQNAEAEKLKATIKELNGLPTQTPEQVAQLDAAREALADLNLSIRKYNIAVGESGTIAGQASAADAELNAQRNLGIALLERSQALHDQAIDRLEQEEGGYARLSDSMREFVDVGLRAGDGLQGTFSDAGEAASSAGDSVEFLGEAAADAKGSVEELGAAATVAGDETKKGTEAAAEGITQASDAVASLKEALEACEPVIDRIAAKLAALQLGS